MAEHNCECEAGRTSGACVRTCPNKKANTITITIFVNEDMEAGVVDAVSQCLDGLDYIDGYDVE